MVRPAGTRGIECSPSAGRNGRTWTVFAPCQRASVRSTPGGGRREPVVCELPGRALAAVSEPDIIRTQLRVPRALAHVTSPLGTSLMDVANSPCSRLSIPILLDRVKAKERLKPGRSGSGEKTSLISHPSRAMLIRKRMARRPHLLEAVAELTAPHRREWNDSHSYRA
jgi:hypothetical protein